MDRLVNPYRVGPSDARDPGRARQAVVAVATTGLAAGGALLGAGTAQAVPDSVWDRLAQCESSGNWSIRTGNGFEGGLQFLPATWTGFGGARYAPRAYRASRTEQIAVAERVLARQGWNAWPECSRALGIRRYTAAPDRLPDRLPARSEPERPRSAGAPDGGSDGGSDVGRGYTVRRGDTLSGIAHAQHVRGGWRELARINTLRDPDRIAVGQHLRLG